MSATGTFTLNCTGAGGNDQKSAIVTVVPAPTVALSPSPAKIANGTTSALTWSSTDADTCTASGGWSGVKPTSGTESTPTLTATSSFTLTCTGIGGSGNKSASVTVTPAVPSVTATPGNAQAVLSWSAVANATSYNVYTSPTSPVTIGGTKTTVSSPGTTLSSLTNGTPIYAAVTAVNADGESALSPGVCAMPTAADTTGLTLYDPLCQDTFDGQKWLNPLFSRSVSGGAMVLSAQTDNAESRTVKFQSYTTSVNVNTPLRVTTLTSNVNIPASTASRTGTAEVRGVVHIVYQPPANRLQAPGASLDQFIIEVGLIDAGDGLRAYRVSQHCDSANCLSRSTTGFAFTDPAGFTPPSGPNLDRLEAPAAYDTTYTLSVSLNETTGIFTWSIAGGSFGGGVSGTVNPSSYLAGNANWTALGANPLGTGGGFLVAQLLSRVIDQSAAGGSSGKVTAKFSNVQVGLNNAAATTYDDFSGTGSNSGANGELSVAKWNNAGIQTAALAGGSYAGHLQGTSVGTTGFNNTQSISLNGNPADINTIQADVNITACASSAGISNRVVLLGNFFNDGSAGPNTPPDTNQANSNVGDVRALLILDCVTDQANLQILRFNTQNTTSVVTVGPPPVIPKIGAAAGNPHTLRLSYDPTTHAFTFQVDGQTPVVVDPTAPGPNVATPVTFVKTANAPLRQIVWSTIVLNGAPAGSTASLDFKLNNVFTAP